MVEAHGRAQLLRFEVVAEQRQRHRVPARSWRRPQPGGKGWPQRRVDWRPTRKMYSDHVI